MLVVVAGCSSAGSDAGVDSVEQIELTFSTWGNENHIAVYEELLETYNEEHPNVNVTIQTTPFPDYQQNMTVLAAGQELPDIGWAAERMIPQFIENGILADLSALREDELFDFDDILPGTITQYEVDDALYGVPFSSPPHIIYYNQTLFEKNGLETPKPWKVAGSGHGKHLKKPLPSSLRKKGCTARISFVPGKHGRIYLPTRVQKGETCLMKTRPSSRGTAKPVFPLLKCLTG